MELKKIQKKVDVWIKEHGVRYFNPLTNMAQLSEEVGEVARIISRRYGEQSEKESDQNKDLAEEIRILRMLRTKDKNFLIKVFKIIETSSKTCNDYYVLHR